MKKFPNKLKNNWKNILFYVFIFLMFFLNFSILDNFLGDNYFNYGFAYNVANGLIPYRDFNMVLFPFSTFLIAFFMKLFGTKLIVYYAVSSLFATLIIYYLNKLEKSVSLVILLFLLIYATGGYNYLMILLFFILLYLEKKNANDYLIGFVLGILIMTKQTTGVLIIPALLLKDKRKIIKRIVGMIIPFQFLLWYLLRNGALYYFIDYTIFGLFDFGDSNSNIGFLCYAVLGISIYLLYKYIKTKNKEILYCLCFQIVAVPIFDLYHTSLALIAFIYYSCRSSGKMLKIANITVITLIIFLLISRANNLFKTKNYYLDTDYNSNYYLTLKSNNLDILSDKLFKYYYSKIENYDVYFVYFDMYYFKLKENIPINKFDLLLTGNSGYDGNNKIKKKIQEMDSKTIFIIHEIEDKGKLYDQTNYEIIEFISNNYQKIDNIVDDFNAYIIE